ncbi:CsbD family protein [Corynebacterium sp. H130]|uniref:CsbD family protein n=1 Tax=Corynebacterium sp. H130 TaxID=3133444 RepID=UPI00309E0969
MSDIKNTFDEVAGKAKEAAGEATGNESLANEGRADQTKAQAKDAVTDAKNKILGSVQE